MIHFNVTPQKFAELTRRMQAMGVREEDLEEYFIRTRGPGGQKVNKTSVAVLLKHIPTGIMVKSQSARSQALNRFLARRMLLDALEKRDPHSKTADSLDQNKIRKQKQRRARRSRAKKDTCAPARPFLP